MSKENEIKWDLRFLSLAKHISAWSKDPSTKVACVIANGKRVVSLGYNGFPQGVEDTEERLNNREIKYPFTIHAEMNALSFASENLSGCTLYNYPFQPCAPCAGPIIQNGIARIVSLKDNNPRWIESFSKANTMFSEAGIELVLYENLIEVL